VRRTTVGALLTVALLGGVAAVVVATTPPDPVAPTDAPAATPAATPPPCTAPVVLPYCALVTAGDALAEVDATRWCVTRRRVDDGHAPPADGDGPPGPATEVVVCTVSP
jgi:hypothetical protein